VERPLREHVAYLEQKIDSLKAQQSDPDRTAGERYQASIDLGIAERALIYFRQAYELEQKVSSRPQKADRVDPAMNRPLE